MKAHDLIDIIGEIKDEYIRDAKAPKRNKMPGWVKLGSLAACFALAIMAVIGTGVLYRAPVTPDTPTNRVPIDKHVPAGDDSETAIEQMLDWDTMLDTQRFPTLSYAGHEFTANQTPVFAENEGDLLGTATMTGDHIKNGEATGEVRTTDVKVYAIRGISTDIAVAVRFSDSDEHSYAYFDYWYTPETLDDFVTQLNLVEYMKTTLCYYENGTGSNTDTIVYEDIDASTVWSMLLDDRTVKNEPDVNPGPRVMSISINVEVFANYNRTISLTADGYLYTNLLETGKFFFIGKDKVEAFVDEVINNHQCYRYIYDLTGNGDIAE